jgi:hypothetical protein
VPAVRGDDSERRAAVTSGNHARPRKVALARAALLLSGATSGGYGLFLTVIGQPWATTTEDGVVARVAIPAAAGVIPLIAAVLVLLGAALDRRLVGIAGAALLLAFALLFMFGVGGVMIPVAALSLVLATTNYTRANRADGAS